MKKNKNNLKNKKLNKKLLLAAFIKIQQA